MVSVEIRCPGCGEVTEIQLEPAKWGVMVQECRTCLRPLELDVRWDEWGDPTCTVERAE
jgi:hypothetical protein